MSAKNVPDEENKATDNSMFENNNDVIPVTFIRGADGITVSAPKRRKKISFTELIQQAQPGEIIHIKRGKYPLVEPVVLEKPLQFIADGPGEVIFIGRQLGTMFRYNGSGMLVLRGINFKSIGASPNFGIRINSGELKMDNCNLEGDQPKSPSCGLVISSDVEATISSSSFSGFGIAISVHDQASVRLIMNKVFNNDTGILFNSTATGYIEKCQFFHNGSNGVELQENSRVTMQENTWKDNQGAGILCMDESISKISRNQSKDNRGGIVLLDEAKSEIEENECSGNLNGIVLQGNASARIVGNDIHENGDSGISIRQKATATIENNQSHENLRGIRILDEARATIKANKIYKNGGFAILDTSRNKSIIEDNNCIDNNDIGDDEMTFVLPAGINPGNLIAQILGSENLSNDPDVAVIPLGQLMQGIGEDETDNVEDQDMDESDSNKDVAN